MARWADDALNGGDLGWPSTFFSVAKAQEFRTRFLNHVQDLLLLGIGLDRGSREPVLARATPPPGAAPGGLCLALEKDQLVAPGGRLLVFDVLGYDLGAFHSYLCGGTEKDFLARLGAQPNGFGLYDDEALASRCAAIVDGDTTLGEPGVWRAWEIRAY